MKKLFILLFILTHVSYAQKAIGIQDLSKDLEQTVTYLASDKLKGRKTGTKGIEMAAKYIEDYFNSNGVLPYFDNYRHHFKDAFKLKKLNAYNVVGYVKGIDPDLQKEIIVVGAHYDHIGRIQSNSNDTIANGANDNASGTAAVMSLARYFAERKSNKRSLLFVLFSAEEMGLLGSKYLAKELKNQGTNIYTVLNFEMIGVPMVDKNYKTYLTGFKNSNMAQLINEYSEQNLVGFLPQAKAYQLFQRSDNFPFYQEFSIPSQTISTFDFTNFEFYHQVGDESQLLDYKHMAEIVSGFTRVIHKMSNSKNKEIYLNE